MKRLSSPAEELTVALMQRIRQYPQARLLAGTRAALAFAEVLGALISVKARDPLRSAAMVTLLHRIRTDSVIDTRRVLEEILCSLGAGPGPDSTGVIGAAALNTGRILRELDGLQDMVHAMPYEIDLLSPDWFRVIEHSVFRVEAPLLWTLTLNEKGKADFTIYSRLLQDLSEQGLIEIRSGGVDLTVRGSAVRYRDVFRQAERTLASVFRRPRERTLITADTRQYRRGDSYRDLHRTRTLRNLVRRYGTGEDASRSDLMIREFSGGRPGIVALALDHSWSMGRSRKLQCAKEATAGLAWAARRSRDRMALIAFSDRATVLTPPTLHYNTIIGKATRLRPDSGTNVKDALTQARRVFQTTRQMTRHLVLITDGIPTSREADVTRDGLEQEVMAEARRLRAMGALISVLCIRDELEEQDPSLALRLARIGRGSFRAVRTRDLAEEVVREYAAVKTGVR